MSVIQDMEIMLHILEKVWLSLKILQQCMNFTLDNFKNPS